MDLFMYCGILFLLLCVYDDDSFVICLNMQIEMWNFGMWILVQNYVVDTLAWNAWRKEWHGKKRHGMKENPRHDMARQRHGKERQDKARHGKVRQRNTWHDKERHAMT
jgi:hypothetical protein